MRKTSYSIALTIAGFLVSAGSVLAAAPPVNVAGAWEMTSQGRNGAMTQTLTIQQDGATIKGTIKGQRGEMPFEGTIEDNKITFSIKRQTQNGGAMVLEYTGTVEGDSIKGKVHSERFGDRDWSATRSR